MRDSFVFYKSFYDALMCLPDDEYCIASKYILDYAINGTMPTDASGIAYAIFCMAKPQIDANNEKFENGKKGGAPKGNQNARKKQPKQPMVDFEKQPKQPMVDFEKQPKQPNVNVNVNDNVNVNNNIVEFRSINRFNNYKQHYIDYDALEDELISNGKDK